MSITRTVIIQDMAGQPFEHVAVRDAAAGPRPGILLCPNVLGTKEADFAYAEKVAALGYSVLVADLFGQGKRTTRADDDAARYMNELRPDRPHPAPAARAGERRP
jgi:dienelactone hydrolase